VGDPGILPTAVSTLLGKGWGMAKTLVAHEQPVAKIFGDDYVFRIPGYQRPYAWTTEQAQELFEDLVTFMQAAGGAVEDMPPYFLGSIVLIKDESAPEADVVDGQQRLTTLTILLAAIRASVAEPSASDLTRLIYEKGSAILGTKDRFRLTLRERDSDFFQTHIQREDGALKLLDRTDGLTDSQNNIRAIAMLYKQRLAELPEADRLRLAQFAVTRCYLVVVATPDLDSAYRIFSVLNSRGLDLAPTDILKSEIIGGIPAVQRDTYTKKWEDAEEDLGRDAFTDLFSHIRMIYRRLKPKGTLIKEFKEHVTEVKQPAQFIDQVLLPMTRAYEEILDSNYESASHAETVNEHLKWLNRLEFNDWVPPALEFTALHRQESGAMAVFFRDLERLAYALLVRKTGINDRIERFSQLTAAIAKGGNLADDVSPLQLTPGEQYEVYLKLDGMFYETFAARARSAILLRLDTLLSGGGAKYDDKTVTVEHVLPQTPPDGSKWLTWFPTPNDRFQWVHRLGNLALLTRKKNSSASNYEFDRKKQSYFSNGGVSPFVLTTQVLDKNEWTPAIVADRQRQLLAILEKHWQLGGRKGPHAATA
jgi:Protein of unknown function DUF262/Protein of unknown function (DUF1524)